MIQYAKLEVFTDLVEFQNFILHQKPYDDNDDDDFSSIFAAGTETKMYQGKLKMIDEISSLIKGN